MFIELLSVKVPWLCCDTWRVAREHVSQMPPLTLRAAAPFPVPKTATPRPQSTSVLLCPLPGALKPMQHCRLQAQLSGVDETKHHFLCKHSFQACPTWLSASSVHFTINYFIHRLSTQWIQLLYYHAVRTWCISLYAISGYGYFPSVHSPQATAEDIETFISLWWTTDILLVSLLSKCLSVTFSSSHYFTLTLL